MVAEAMVVVAEGIVVAEVTVAAQAMVVVKQSSPLAWLQQPTSLT